ncbi:PAS domain-containing protein [Colwellia sp. MEBiC06753]
MLSTQSILSRFTKRYLLALVLIGVLVTCSYIVLESQFNAQDDFAELINRAGEQRMLSQKISLYAQALINNQYKGESKSEVANELINAANRMKDNQRFLNNKLTKLSDEHALLITQRYQGRLGLNQKVNDFVDSAILIANSSVVANQYQAQFYLLNAQSLLVELDAVVKLYEKITNFHIEQLKHLATGIWVVTIVTIFLVAWLIFKPMRAWLGKTYERLTQERNRVADFQFAMNKHSVVIQLDLSGQIVLCNEKFYQTYGYALDELNGCSFDILLSDGKLTADFSAIAEHIQSGYVWRKEITTRAKNGREFWFSTTVVPLKSALRRTESYIVLQNDISEQKYMGMALTKLHEITADPHLTSTNKIQQLLVFGCQLFQLPLGIVSEIVGNDYKVDFICAQDDNVKPGDIFELNNTYCVHTLNANKAVGYHKAGESEISYHPCYQEFGLEAYIGAPLKVDGQAVGTLSFSSPEPYPAPFTANELELVQLIAQWIGFEISTMKQAKQVNSQQELMEQMGQLAMIGAWELNLEKSQLYWSPITKAIHEVEQDYLPELDAAIAFYKPGFNRGRIVELTQELIKNGKPFHEELELTTAKGREIWVASNGQAEFREGVCVRIYGSFQDITQRVLAQRALAESNERLAFVMQSTEVGIWDWEIETGRTVFNERWANIVGYRLSELEPVSIDTWLQLAHPEDLARSEQLLARHWRGETTYYSIETRMKHKAGHWVWVYDNGKVVEWTADGKPKRMIGTHIDISQRKATELLIQDQNQRMALAADSAGIGVWDLNVLTNEITWDDWMYKIYGVEPKQFGGAIDAWKRALHPEDIEQLSATLNSVIERGGKINTQFRIRWPNGEVRHIKASAISKSDETGRVTNLVGVNYDITERVENEIALTQAKIAAEAASTAKNEFLASMSHEIRTPMNGVIGMLELLEDTPLTTEQHHKVNIAQSSANSLLQLINDILDFSKIDAGKLELEAIPFDLVQMTGELIESLALPAQSKNLELILDTSALPSAKIIGDPGRIRQILTNLISNSIKFTHQGEVAVKLMLIDDDAGAWRLKLKVSDTGIGIEPSKQAALFDCFSQVDSSTTRKYGGTGLGLTIVKRLCSRMDGDVQVISELDIGSHFICDIKVGKVAGSSVASTNFSELGAVLVVDANKSNREMLAKQLTAWQLEVETTNDVQHGLELAQRRFDTATPFDLLLIDYQLFDNGHDWLVATLEQYKNLGVRQLVLLTNMQDKLDSSLPNEHKIHQLAKPVTVFKLLNIITLVFGQDEHLVMPQALAEQLTSTDEPNIDIVDKELFDEVNVLLVEDNRVNQMVAKGVLNKLGIDCDIAGDGLEALAILNKAKQSYDLALMDIQMPKMDGFKATQSIRQGKGGKQHQDMIIIAMTANAMAGDKEKCLAAGMNDYLAKPINKAALAKMINQYIKITAR